MSSIAEDIIGFYNDPLAYVLYAFPWGEPGPLSGQYPDLIQISILEDIKKEIEKKESGDIDTALRIAVASGHGIGKSALTSWIILWFLSTRPNPQVVVTAGTASQLTSKTWREVAKWKRLAINGDWFEWTATKMYHKDRPDTWFASALAWSESNPDAFAGTHEEHVLVIFDEASSIADVIWETVEGAMTTQGSMWLAFGNPIRNTGRFFECFGRFRHRWVTHKIDSRKSSLTNKNEIQQWLEDYGEDHDFFRVRVRGEFPHHDDQQFISPETVRSCMQFKATNFDHMPVLIGVDVALRQDKTVVAVRQGNKLHFLKKFHRLNALQVANHVADIYSSFPHAMIFVDTVGVGDSVVDFIRSIGIKVIEVNGGMAADNPEHYLNKRAEMWGRMKQWLEKGAEIPSDDELFDDLTGIRADYNLKNQMCMEKKQSMFSRGLPSPDTADALAHTFFMNVRPVGAQSLKPQPAKMQWNVY